MIDVKAKDASLWGKIIGGVFIVVCSVLKWCNILNATIQEISLVGFSIMGLFSTVDLNIMLEKFTGYKKKDSQ